MITLQQIARAADCSLATVSYALRDDPRIRSETRTRVQKVAEQLGYRPNPRFSALMSHIRNSRPVAAGERIAFVWVHTPRAESAKDPFLQRVFLGAQRRAAQMGFDLDQFWTSDSGMTDRRLQQIIRARGIVGVVLSPVTTDEASLALDWDWASFSAAVIGNVTWTPELHHAGHHHFLAMRMVLLELGKIGRHRPATLIEPRTNERAKRAWEAAFLTHHPDPSAAPALVRVAPPDTLAAAARWLRSGRPDALIVSDTALLDAPGLRAACHELALPVVTLHWNTDTPRGLGGIDQRYDRVAAHAVDLVAAQLNANETGVPDLPRIMLFPGRWVAPRLPRPARR